MLPSASEYRNYSQITECTEEYFERLGDSPLGMGWPNVPDAVRRYEVMLDVIKDQSKPVRLLDFGCGTGHLFEYIAQRSDLEIDYHGVDLSSRFIERARLKYPDTRFDCVDVLVDTDVLSKYDYAVINGVFTSKCQMSHSVMLAFVNEIIRTLFQHVRCGLAFNAMSKHVDWERDDLFHLSLDEIACVLCRDLSREFVIRNDYGLYEFTTYVYQSSFSRALRS